MDEQHKEIAQQRSKERIAEWRDRMRRAWDDSKGGKAAYKWLKGDFSTKVQALRTRDGDIQMDMDGIHRAPRDNWDPIFWKDELKD